MLLYLAGNIFIYKKKKNISIFKLEHFLLFYILLKLLISNCIIFIGILPKRKDGSENILSKLQSVIDGFDNNKSTDKGTNRNNIKQLYYFKYISLFSSWTSMLK